MSVLFIEGVDCDLGCVRPCQSAGGGGWWVVVGRRQAGSKQIEDEFHSIIIEILV